MTACLIASFLLAASFVGVAIWRERSLPESISSLVGMFSGGWRWLWTVWLWLVSVLSAPSLTDALTERWEAVGFLMVACLLFCGAMPVFMEDRKMAHDILGVAAGILSQVCVLVTRPWCLLLWIVMAAVTVVYMRSDDSGMVRRMLDGKGVFLAEVICAVSLYCAVI